MQAQSAPANFLRRAKRHTAGAVLIQRGADITLAGSLEDLAELSGMQAAGDFAREEL